jgi:hypothetical protein
VVTDNSNATIEVDAAEAVAALATATLTSITLEAVGLADVTLWQQAWDTFVAMSAAQQVVALSWIREHVVEAMQEPERDLVSTVVWLPLLVLMIRAMKVKRQL